MTTRSAARWRSSLAIVVTVGLGTPLLAQAPDRSFADLGRSLHPGDTIIVTGRESGELQGRLVRMSASSLVVTVDGRERVIAASEIGWIERRGDPLWNGALLGLGLALPAAGSAGASCSPNCDREVPQAALVGAALGVGIGTLIDYAWRGRTLVFGMPPTGRTEPPVDSLGELWSRVRPGDLVSVRLTNGADVAGKFARASESTLTVAVDGQPRDLSVIIVQQVERRRGGNHVKRNMLIGAPLGALLGSGRCYRVDTYSRPTSGPYCGASVGIGAAAGAGIGAVLGSMTWSRTLVYRARSE